MRAATFLERHEDQRAMRLDLALEGQHVAYALMTCERATSAVRVTAHASCEAANAAYRELVLRALSDGFDLVRARSPRL